MEKHICPKLSTENAGLQEKKDRKATKKFKELVEEKLTLPNGRKKRVFLRLVDSHFDKLLKVGYYKI
ncbi:MAG: hypothetical protein KIIPBIDF_00254 [Candidatus Methanoperedenaceae archaeon GB50]|nr:MAG: hypothetical protein KIIPBIDF_00254 [Candidatus Methanoperedenaceae archaeon GB50]